MFSLEIPKPSTLLVQTFLLVGLVVISAPCWGQTLYNFGNPTADEQLYLEFINRARANPAAEGARLAATTDPEVLSAYTSFGVNLTMMQSEFNALTAAAPLAPNSKLTGIARSHSSWMLANATQAHNESPSNTPFTRMTTAGYSYSTAAENVYASAKSVWYGHAGFQVDWGSGTGGMQYPRGHRAAIHNASLREVGVGVVLGNNGSSIGPQLVTQDFGTQLSSPPTLGTGVAYYDLNSNNFYDIGEGISGLTVNVNGASYYCTTAQGGGWTVPVPTAAATRSVTFSGLNVNQSVNLTFPASTNAKADLKLAYSPPTITSPSTASNNIPHSIAFSAIGGATSYKWNRWTTSASVAENCENTTNITSSTTGSYSVICTTAKQQGSASFHLAMPTAVSQSIELKPLYYGNASPSLTFQSRVGYATTTERCKVQVKEEGGNWTDVYDQAGSGGAGETTFRSRSATLTGMSGKAFRVRFLLSFTGGSRYDQTDDNVGWLIDAINFTNVSTLSNNSLTTLTTNSGSFTPTATGSYLMAVTPVISGRDFPSSYQNLTVSTATSQTLTLAASPASVMENSGTGMAFTFTRSGTTTAALTANFSVSGTAALTTDYTTSGAASFSASAGTVNFAAGVTTATVTVTPVADTAVEPDETIMLTATTGTGYTVGSPSAATTTIINDDATVGIAVSPANVTEDGTPNLVYSFTRTGATASALTVNFTVAGSATLSTDYTASGAATFTASNGSVTLAAGASSATVTLNPTADTTVESDETVLLTLSSGVGYTIGSPSSVMGAITNDDTSVSVAISPSSVVEDGAHPIIYTFSRSGVSSGALTANFTVGGSAAAHVDYSATGAGSFTASSGTVTFPAGATTANVQLNPIVETIVEPDETVNLSVISNAGYSVGAAPIATGTILNDDVDYASWAAALEISKGLSAGSLTTKPNDDYDHDGRSNLIEFAFGADPVIPNDPAPRMPKLVPSSTHLVLQYQVDTSLGNLTFTPEVTTSLGTWKTQADEGLPSGFTVTSSSGTIQTREAKVPLSSGINVFLRVRVNSQ